MPNRPRGAGLPTAWEDAAASSAVPQSGLIRRDTVRRACWARPPCCALDAARLSQALDEVTYSVALRGEAALVHSEIWIAVGACATLVAGRHLVWLRTPLALMASGHPRQFEALL